ncbi:MAG: hypothetical protein JXR10_17910 [Cyclobacteriaceae bacterium]
MKYLNSGKLEIRRNLIFAILVVITSCGRTPSEDRFEQATGIPIPRDVEVLKDEYQDMIQDYAIEYSIKLTTSQVAEISNLIRASDIFNPVIGTELTEQQWFTNESANTVWYRTNIGYYFANRNDRTGVTAKLDTLTLVMEFSEWYD